MINASCVWCGNTSGYDKQSLKGSTWKFNGVEGVLCVFCEDEMLKKIAKTRGLRIFYGDGGEIASVQFTDMDIKIR